MKALRVAGFLNHSTVNGDGFRSVLFVSGCPHNCPGCHNEEMQDFSYGETTSVSEVLTLIEKNKPLIDGITLSGGEPFEQCEGLLELVPIIKSWGLSIWCYTGYLYEVLIQDPLKMQLLSYIDVLVDGPFIRAAADENLKYKGSSNQRILKLSHGKIKESLYL